MLKTTVLRQFFLAALLCFTTFTLMAQPTHYKLTWPDPQSHQFHIEVHLQATEGNYTDLRMPAWRPGRYHLQNYSAAVSQVSAGLGDGPTTLRVEKQDKDTWRVYHGNNAGEIRFYYRVYANKIDAGSSFLTREMVYFNPINLFVHVPGQMEAPVTLETQALPEGWKTATQLEAGDAPNTYKANSYHYFVDSPTIFSPHLTQFTFTEAGVNYYVHFAGNCGLDPSDEDANASWLNDFRKIVQEQTAIFGTIPIDEYHFIYLLVPPHRQLRHAVEHSNSAMFVLPEYVAADPSAVSNTYGITSHEFWHLWNVKRIRPAAMWPYDYSTESYTHLHWFTEGVTDYYTYLTLTRAGIWSEDKFLDHMGKLIGDLENAYGPGITSPASSSYNSWLAVSPYMVPNHYASYYSLGKRSAFLLDMKIRVETEGEQSFDDVFRYLWDNYYMKDLGVPEDGIITAISDVTGKNLEDFYLQVVHQPQPLPYDDVLPYAGLTLKTALQRENVAPTRKIGLQRYDVKPSGSIELQQLRPDAALAQAGVAEGDLLLAIGGEDASEELLLEKLEALEPGGELELELRPVFGEDYSVTVSFKEEHLPRTYDLVVTEGPLKPALENWLQSHHEE